jgi:hypothetical protein
MGIGRETDRESERSGVSETGETGPNGDGGLYVDEVAVNSSREERDTRVG